MSGEPAAPLGTLSEAHAARVRLYPGRDASAREYELYHRKAAEIYGQVALVDTDHQHEARWWASQSRADADRYRDQQSGQFGMNTLPGKE